MKFVAVIVMLIVSFAIFANYTRPTYAEAKNIEQEIQNVKEVLQKIQSIRELKEKLSRTFAQFTEERLQKLKKLLPDHVDNIKLLLDIDGIALQYGMRLKDVKISKQENQDEQREEGQITQIQTTQGSDVQSMTMSFTVESSYENIKSFIKDLESSLRIIEIEKLSIEPIASSAFTQVNALDELLSDANNDQENANTDVIQPKEKYKASFVVRTYWLKKDAYDTK